MDASVIRRSSTCLMSNSPGSPPPSGQDAVLPSTPIASRLLVEGSDLHRAMVAAFLGLMS